MFRQFAHCIRNYLHNCTFGAKLSFLFVPRIKSMKMRVSWLLTNVNSYLNFSISVWLTGNFGIPAIFHQITRILKLIFNNHAPGKFYKSFNIYVRRRGKHVWNANKGNIDTQQRWKIIHQSKMIIMTLQCLRTLDNEKIKPDDNTGILLFWRNMQLSQITVCDCAKATFLTGSCDGQGSK